jgi:hypothetical protein
MAWSHGRFRWRRAAIVAARARSFQGYIGLSPFTQWRIDFDLKGNEWLDLNAIKTVVLTFEGRTLGPGRRLNESDAHR